MKEELQQFIHSHPRNKLVFTQKKITELIYIDLGIILSQLITPRLEDKRIGLIASDMINKIISENIAESPMWGKYIAVKNIGILFEPQLQLNIRSIFESISKEMLLFIQFEGTIHNNKLYFLTEKNGISTDLSGMSFIEIN